MTDKLQHWIEHPELLNRETLYELRTLLARYPYFATARLLYLKNLYLLHDASFGDELRKAAIWIPDRKQLFNLIEGEKQSQARQSKRARAGQTDDETCLDRTLQLIDDFLASAPEEQQPETDTANLQSDYISYMLREEELPEEGEANAGKPMRGQGLIDSFLEKSESGFPRFGQQADKEREASAYERDMANQEQPIGIRRISFNKASEDETDEPLPEESEDEEEETERARTDEHSAIEELEDDAEIETEIEETVDKISFEETPKETDGETEDETKSNGMVADDEEDDGFFTETLARIYIKQQRYEKALEIIRKLSLKYPKKNTYFADQIRFLEKLIINTKSK